MGLVDQPVVDCDIHATVPTVEALFPYLSEHWREYIRTSAFKGPTDTAYPPHAPTTFAPGTQISEGSPPGSTLAQVQEQVLDPWGVEVGILNCAYSIDSLHNPDTAAAIAAAVNDWLIAEWLDKEPRLRASVVVPTRVPEMAAREIDRVGAHPGFDQVFLPVRSEAPYGHRRYLPIFEAATRNNLVVSLQFGGAPGNPPTGAGWPSYYIEEYVGMAQVFQTQVLSLIVEGVFDRFPGLRVALVEGGWTWLPSLMWRIDKDWKGLRRAVERGVRGSRHGCHARAVRHTPDDPLGGHRLRHSPGAQVTQGPGSVPFGALAPAPRDHRRSRLRRLLLSTRQPERRAHRCLA